MNRTFIIGHITKNAETRTVNVSGVPTLVTDFTVAANEGFGENQKTAYYRVSVWRDRGAKMAPHLVKGRAVAVTGVTNARAWKDNDGNARAQLEMSNPQVEFVGKKPGDPDDLPFIPDEEIPA